MSDSSSPEPGRIGWVDLTVPDAATIRDFYQEVVGWKPHAVSMGDYDDFSMLTPRSGDTVAGVCHARGGNAEIPPQWMIYITVENADRSAAACEAGGGKLVVPVKTMGAHGRYCIIEDPAGAVAALFEPSKP